MIRGLADLQRAGLATQSMALSVVSVASIVVVAGVAALIDGRSGVLAAVAAGAACFAGGEMGLVVCRLLRGLRPGFAGFVAAMLPRMGIPLACGVLLHIRRHPLAEAGFLMYVLVLYPVILAAETILSLPAGPGSSGGTRGSVTAPGSDGS